MAKSMADISNSAVRILLQEVGKYYDESRKLERFIPTPEQVRTALKAFDDKCCYCGTPLTIDTFTQDHAIPENKESLGLHAWGNVVLCCAACNEEKHHRDWEVFLNEKYKNDPASCKERRAAIEEFKKHYGYDPFFNLQSIARELYDDMRKIGLY
jgi:hypothetical protein